MELSDFVGFPIKCFKFFGVNLLNPTGDATWKAKLLEIYRCFTIVNFCLILLSLFTFVIKHITDSASVAQPAIGYFFLAIVKSMTFKHYRKEVSETVEILDELFPRTTGSQKVLNVAKYLKSYKVLERALSLMIYSVGSLFFAVPVFKFILTGIWINKLPYLNWFPFDEYDPKFYNFVFLWEAFNSFSTIASVLAPDLTLYAFITLISMHFDSLCQSLRDLKNVPEAQVKKQFIELIELHQTLMKLSGNLEKIFSISIFFNFLGSSIFICLACFQAFIGTNSNIKADSLLLLVSSLTQILLLCFFGTKLSTASGNVADAAYDSGWSVESKFFLLMIIRRSQKPAVITAYKFSPVSLNAFMNVSIESRYIRLVYQLFLNYFTDFELVLFFSNFVANH